MSVFIQFRSTIRCTVLVHQISRDSACKNAMMRPETHAVGTGRSVRHTIERQDRHCWLRLTRARRAAHRWLVGIAQGQPRRGGSDNDGSFSDGSAFSPRLWSASQSYTLDAGVIDDICGFSAAAFGTTPREAAQVGPQHRHLLELRRAGPYWHSAVCLGRQRSQCLLAER